MSISGIYKITNLTNNKLYIGKTNSLKKRFNEHKNNLYKYDYPLYRAFRKYGIENFEVYIGNIIRRNNHVGN